MENAESLIEWLNEQQAKAQDNINYWRDKFSPGMSNREYWMWVARKQALQDVVDQLKPGRFD